MTFLFFMDMSLPTWPRNYMGSHFTHKYHLISQLYLAIISTNTSSASQIIFIFVKCEIYLGGEGHHKTYSMALGRMP